MPYKSRLLYLDSLLGFNVTLDKRRLLGLDTDHNLLCDRAETVCCETIKAIVRRGPFAGPFIVDVVRCTGSAFRTKYFWNSHQVLRSELLFLGKNVSIDIFCAIFDAFKQGIQYDNSTVPMIVTDLLSNKELTSNDVMGEPTQTFFNQRV